MSAHVLAEGGGFQAPGVSDFYWPLIGGDSAWAITRPAIVLLLSVGLIAWFLLAASRKRAIVPGKLQFAGEGLYTLVRNGIGREIIGSHDFLRFLPLLVTQFTLILVNNWFGVVPFIQFPTMSRIGFPVALTLITFVVYHAVGFKTKGVKGYAASLLPPGLPTPLKPYIYLLELITFLVTRPLTLALRLFANMFAGHLLLLVFILGAEYMIVHGGPGLKVTGVLSGVLAIVMTFFEILVEFLQAYIFTLLTALYIAGNLADEH